MSKSLRNTGNGTVISGTNGDDVLSGVGGSFILSGGNGNDTYIVDDAGDQVDEKNNGGIDLVVSSIDWTLGDHIENLTLDGTGDLSGTGNDLANIITGNSGDNVLYGLGGDDTLYGGDGDDTLTGGGGSDTIDGGNGSDTAIFKGSSTDYLIERVGDDLHVTSLSGTVDILRNVELLSFDDTVIAASDIPGSVSPDPQAIDDAAVDTENNPVTVDVLNNDLGQGLSVASATNGSMGLVTVNGDGTVTYRPNLNAYGTDSFSYTITDSLGRTSTATVSVDVLNVNDPPVAQADSYAAVAGEIFTSTGSVLDNDSDPDGDALKVASYDVTTSAGGSVQMNADGTFSYAPLAGFTGTDTFTYTVDDGNGGQASTSVTLTVDPAAPTAVADSITTAEDQSVVIPVLSNDSGDALSVTAVSDGAIGSVSINGDGTLTYAPLTNANGADSFSYTITDSLGRTASASVSVDVSPVNDAPVAVDDSYSTTEGTAISGAVLGNDSDPDGDTLTVSAYQQTSAAGGLVSMATDGTFSYTAASGFTGADSFTYTASDGNGGFSTATVSLTVDPAPDPAAMPYYVAALLEDTYRMNYPEPYGTADSVTFTFLSDVPSYYGNGSWAYDGFQAFSAQQQDATRALLDAISSFANISFVEVASAEEADITFGLCNLGTDAGMAVSPSADGVGNNDNDVWLDAASAGDMFALGSRMYQVLLHETGHVLGMDHISNIELSYEENNRQYSVMSANKPISLSVEPETYMLYDIATLQYIYGANTSSATGDDVYTFADYSRQLKSIWDAGGNDVLDMSAATYGVDLDLRQGAFSTIDPWGQNTLSIAFGTVIEDAIGGAYDDHITGNAADNCLTGGGGADVFGFAQGWGNDVITDFTPGEDTLDFSATGLGFADLTITSSGGDTVLAYDGNSLVLEGVSTVDQGDFVFA